MCSNMCMCEVIYMCLYTSVETHVSSYTIPCTYHYQLSLTGHDQLSLGHWLSSQCYLPYILLMYLLSSRYYIIHNRHNQIYQNPHKSHLTRINELNQQHTHKHTHYYCYNWLVIMSYLLYFVFQPKMYYLSQ